MLGCLVYTIPDSLLYRQEKYSGLIREKKQKNSYSHCYKEWHSNLLDCSQSPIFSWDRLDIQRLTATAILIFKCPEGADAGDYSSRWGGGGWGRRGASSQTAPPPLSSFDTHARWQPVTQSARSRRSYRKIEDCEQSSNLSDMWRFTFKIGAAQSSFVTEMYEKSSVGYGFGPGPTAIRYSIA